MAHVMLVPSLACPSSCAYCFGPHRGGAAMSVETVDATVCWLQSVAAAGSGEKLDLTFHGGEPLVAGARFFREALPRLRSGLSRRRLRLSMQSNLWLLDDELCGLFREHGVAIGTSLDGPEEINDAQRGAGYFRRTMDGLARARRHGLSVGCICTFTARSAQRADEVFDFFTREGLSFSIHSALPSLRHPEAAEWALSPEAHGELLVGMLDRYLGNLERTRIGTLDSICRSVSAGRGGICTFGDCLGEYLAVGPDGTIYPCQRFAGMADFALGNVRDCPSREALAATPVWRAFRAREEQIEAECGSCAHLKYCRGGCPYNALVVSGGRFGETLRDPHCPAYRRVFDHVVDRALAEVFSEENLAVVVGQADSERGLLRKGRLLSLMNGGPHPHETAQHARRALMAVALASTRSPEAATDKLEAVGLGPSGEQILDEARALQARLVVPTRGLNNLYLHATFACPLHCAHCYAEADAGRREAFAVADASRVVREAAALGFRHAVITGGEPLAHPEREQLLDALAGLRREVKPLLTVLRTSLGFPLSGELLRRIAVSTDEVVVSVDGDRAMHDGRRGAGRYDVTLRNLRALLAFEPTVEVSLAAVLPASEVVGKPGESVRTLAKELGIRRVRFRPVLPLGRATESQPDLAPETLLGHVAAEELVEYGVSPVASCGLGQNLYVEPDGSSFPCYAWCGRRWRLGDVRGPGGLRAVVGSDGFLDLRRHTVDTREKCRECAWRYLCGGACRAWSRPGEDAELDDAPRDCRAMERRAAAILRAALGTLGIAEAEWRAAGLPLPEAMGSVGTR